jgi:hypothetical protein
MCLAGVALGWGQPSETGGGEGEATAQPPASLAPVVGTLGTFNGEVQLQLEKFGVGNVARAGDWCGIRLKMLDSSAKQRNVVVRLMSADSDGDHPIYERSLTLNPGVWQGVWMYTRLPFAIDPSRDMVASVYEGIDDEGSATGLSAGKLLGRMPLSPQGARLVTPGLGMFGLVGTGRYGLKGYAMPPTGEHFGYFTHEAYEMVDGLTPGDLPDHYAGLSPLEFLVWASGEPSELRAERASALRHWIARGGHLVVILPAIGQSWTSDASNELFDLLPAVTIQRREGVDLTEYRPILNFDADAPLPTKDAVVHVFTPKVDAKMGEAMTILSGPDGGCVVARRLVGLGAVTLVGLDLSRTVFAQGQSIDPQVFWHRVLGKRGEIPNVRDPNSLLTSASRSPYPVDADIAFDIAKTGHSAIGVSLGFIIFGLYWLVAGPLGYAALKKGGQTKHAWMGFVVVGMVFTAIAWGGATLIRPGRVEGSHLTFLDHVYGQDVQRARSWMGLLLPSYGTTRISVGDPEAAKFDSMAGSTANLITPWEPLSDAGRSAWVSFPDARNYTIDARRYDAIEVPTRATVKQFRADWAGGPRWKMPFPVEEIKINENAGPQQAQMTGTLRHDLPATLSEVVIIHVQPQLTPAVARASTEPGVKGQRPPEMTARGWVYRYQGAWGPGEELDLGVLTLLGGQSRTALTTYLDGFLPASSIVPMIETINLTKRYGELVALNNLNLTINEGDCFGFIGPNGAGKTTTIKILATLLKPSSGQANVAGSRSAIRTARSARSSATCPTSWARTRTWSSPSISSSSPPRTTSTAAAPKVVARRARTHRPGTRRPPK